MGRRTINGYYICARLCGHVNPSKKIPFRTICEELGPLYWQNLRVLEKMYFKRLASSYRLTHLGQEERKKESGEAPGRWIFLQTIFDGNTEEEKQVMKILEPVHEKIFTKYKTASAKQNSFKNCYQQW